jgi:hypothetical protein
MTDKELKLTQKQELLLQLIYEDGLPDNIITKINEVKEQAGYVAGNPAYAILKTIKKQVIERNTDFMALLSGQAINALKDVIESPTKPGSDNIIKAANSLLDRTGFGKKETQELEIKADKGIVILPAKKD